MDDRPQRELEAAATELLARGLGLARFMMRNQSDAEDVLQDAFITAMRRVNDVRPDELWPWFAAILVNTSRNAYRKRARRTTSELMDQDPVMAADPSAPVDQAHLSQALHAALEELPEREREAIGLTYLAGLSHRDAAKELGVPRRTLSSRVSSGLERMRAKMGSRWQEAFALAYPLSAGSLGVESASAALTPSAAEAVAEVTASPAISGLQRQARELLRAHRNAPKAVAAAVGGVGFWSWLSASVLMLIFFAFLVGIWFFGRGDASGLQALFNEKESPQQIAPIADSKQAVSLPGTPPLASGDAGNPSAEADEIAPDLDALPAEGATLPLKEEAAQPVPVWVTGRVVEGVGEVEAPQATSIPIANAQVWATAFGDEEGVLIAPVTSDADGYFRIGPIPRESYISVFFAHPSYYTDRPFVVAPSKPEGPRVVLAGEWLSSKELFPPGSKFMLSPGSRAHGSGRYITPSEEGDPPAILLIGVRGASISGQVVDESGQPIERALIRMRETPSGLYAAMVCEVDGTFSLGPYQIGAIADVTVYAEGYTPFHGKLYNTEDGRSGNQIQMQIAHTLAFDLSEIIVPRGCKVHAAIRRSSDSALISRVLDIDIRELVEVFELPIDEEFRIEVIASPSSLAIGQSEWVSPRTQIEGLPVKARALPIRQALGELSLDAAKLAEGYEEFGELRAYLIRGAEAQGDWNAVRRWMSFDFLRDEYAASVTPGERFSAEYSLPGAYQWIVMPRKLAAEINRARTDPDAPGSGEWDSEWNRFIFISQRFECGSEAMLSPVQLQAPLSLGGLDLIAGPEESRRFRVMPMPAPDPVNTQFALPPVSSPRCERLLTLDASGQARVRNALVPGLYALEMQRGEEWIEVHRFEVPSGGNARVVLGVNARD